MHTTEIRLASWETQIAIGRALLESLILAAAVRHDKPYQQAWSFRLSVEKSESFSDAAH